VAYAGVDLQGVFSYLPLKVRQKLEGLPPQRLSDLEEIRLRVGQPVALRFQQTECFLAADNSCVSDPQAGEILSAQEMQQAVLLLSNSSFYAITEELQRGYLTLPGGHRVGLCGRAVLADGFLKAQTDISGINVRIARALLGVADSIYPLLRNPHLDGRPYNTLLVSPPRAGKTTILRDLARRFSQQGYNVSIVDERSEIAAMWQGEAQFSIGPRSDVMDACPKAEGMMLMIRSMSPDIIICDEIGRQEDAYAIREAINAGVSIIASAHGCNESDLWRRPVLKQILEEKSFERIVFLSRRQGPGTVEYILQADEEKEEESNAKNYRCGYDHFCISEHRALASR
jgi:stage III sporulation protein AA